MWRPLPSPKTVHDRYRAIAFPFFKQSLPAFKTRSIAQKERVSSRSLDTVPPLYRHPYETPPESYTTMKSLLRRTCLRDLKDCFSRDTRMTNVLLLTRPSPPAPICITMEGNQTYNEQSGKAVSHKRYSEDRLLQTEFAGRRNGLLEGWKAGRSTSEAYLDDNG